TGAQAFGNDNAPTEVKLWDTATNQVRLTLSGHASLVYGAAFSPDGTLLATAGYDKTVRLWDAATGRALATLTGRRRRAFLSVAFSPDGKMLAAGHVHEVRLWEVGSWRPLPTLPGQARGVAFSPDGALLAAAGGSDRVVRLWRAPALWEAAGQKE